MTGRIIYDAIGVDGLVWPDNKKLIQRVSVWAISA
jgi:hypothetical protein